MKIQLALIILFDILNYYIFMFSYLPYFSILILYSNKKPKLMFNNSWKYCTFDRNIYI